MKAKQCAAVELLLAHPDTVVAEMLGVRLATLRRWMRSAEFARALRAREQEQRTGAARIARQALVNAAAHLAGATAAADKQDPKVLLDLLKAGGVFEAGQTDPVEALGEAIRRLDTGDSDED